MNQPSPPADSDKEKKLNRILAEYLQRRDAGQPVDQAALLKAYPELADGLQSYCKTPAARQSYRYEKGRLQPMPKISFFRQWAVLSVLVGVLSFLSVTYYVLIYLKSGNQTLAVHVDDEWLREQGGEVSLLVDGSSHTISTKSANGENLTVVVTLGQHTFSVKHGDTVVHDPKKFDIEKDGRRILQITATEMQLTHSVAESPQDSPDRTKDPSPLPVASVTDKSGNSMAAAPANLPLLARAPFDALQAAKYQQAWATAINQPVEIQNTMGMKLRLIPPGEFMMGSPESEKDRRHNEGPVHLVRISRPFSMGTTEVTQSQWFAVMGTRAWEGDKMSPPVISYRHQMWTTMTLKTSAKH